MSKSKSTKREIRQARRRKKQLINKIIWGTVGVIIAGAIGMVVFKSAQPSRGEDVPLMTASHVNIDTDPGPYNSNPPTSGPHYGSEMDAGFYDLSALDNAPAHPEGYLVHNLEHGYVIFWYNCDVLQDSCETLQTQIRDVMKEYNNFKVIAYPWPSIDVPLVITSWGKLQRFETFDLAAARAFVKTNRNRAPEPNAP